jgi:hypothetical protein
LRIDVLDMEGTLAADAYIPLTHPAYNRIWYWEPRIHL